MVLDFNDYIKTPEFKSIKEQIVNSYKMFVYKVNKKTNKYKLIIKANDNKEIDAHLEKKYKNKKMDNYYFIYFKIDFHKYEISDLLVGGPISVLSQVYLFENNKMILAVSKKLDPANKFYFGLMGRIFFAKVFIDKNKNNFFKDLLKYFDNIIKKLVNKKERLVPIGINFYGVAFE